MSTPKQDMFDVVAGYVPAEFRTDYWRTVARFRELRPDDEILQFFQAMGILTLILRDLPPKLVDERKLWQELLEKMEGRFHKLADTTSQQVTVISSRMESLNEAIEKNTTLFNEGCAQMENASQEAVKKIDVDGMAQRLTARIEERVVKRFDGIATNVEDKLGLLKKVGEEADRTVSVLHRVEFWPQVGAIAASIFVFLLLMFFLGLHSLREADVESVNARLDQIQSMATTNQQAFVLLTKYNIKAEVMRVTDNSQLQFGRMVLRLTPALAVEQEEHKDQPKSGYIYFPIPETWSERVQANLGVRW